ncbi:MAG: hypothetical protein A2X86_03945 [Bdellovibrionales bacterium GWA2_49_15]|nr:MAG: hypothetical protein A2X86_03945 [Bdellovibrionales bacterium GWA2_49_15]HAZ12369.1 hypothetical protein [Bdellovibrionales bacterium]
MRSLIILHFFLCSFLAFGATTDGYPGQEQVDKELQVLSARFPQLMKLESIGKSVQGREIWVVRLHDKTSELPVERVALIAGIHGDEIVGRELLMRLLPDLLEGQKKDRRIKELFLKREIILVPCLNPDGCENKTRTNAQGFDLNRAFPDFTIDGPENSPDGRPPEVVAWMKFQKENPIAFSLSYHGGEIPTVNYPWDNSPEKFPLQNLARTMALEYAGLNPSMRGNRQFPGGAAHGNSWYAILGGMQDWSLFFHKNLQLTVEVSLLEWPPYETMPEFYRQNQAGMLNFLLTQ